MKDKILIFIIGILLGAIITTAGFLIYNKTIAKNSNQEETTQMNQNSNGQMGEPPSGDMQEPPEKPNGDNNEGAPSGNSQEPPAKPNGDNGEEPPAKPEDSNNTNS